MNFVKRISNELLYIGITNKQKMETSSSLIILALLMLLVIVAYSKTTIKYVESGKNNLNNLNNLNNSNNSSRKKKSGVSQSNNVSSKATTLYGFPEKDEYMSQTLKEQINNLESKFYYDNCQFEPIN